jgi:hypothetical protein
MRMLKARIAALAVSAIGLGLIAAPVAQGADSTIHFNNWQVGGTLGIKKLNQNIQIPPGSTFNGVANITQGTISGNTAIPDFTTTVRILGLVPSQVTLSIKETKPTAGTISFDEDGTATTHATVSTDVRIKKLSMLGLSVPPGANCHTSSPVVLPLNGSATLAQLGTQGLSFTGTYNLPQLTGCGLLTPTLNLLMAGPNNPFALSLKPPKPPA